MVCSSPLPVLYLTIGFSYAKKSYQQGRNTVMFFPKKTRKRGEILSCFDKRNENGLYHAEVLPTRLQLEISPGSPLLKLVIVDKVLFPVMVSIINPPPPPSVSNTHVCCHYCECKHQMSHQQMLQVYIIICRRGIYPCEIFIHSACTIALQKTKKFFKQPHRTSLFLS